MTALQELNKLLQAMPIEEQEKMASVLLEVLRSREWDTQIEEDAMAGKLDNLIQKAGMNHRNGRTSSLPK